MQMGTLTPLQSVRAFQQWLRARAPGVMGRLPPLPSRGLAGSGYPPGYGMGHSETVYQMRGLGRHPSAIMYGLGQEGADMPGASANVTSASPSALTQWLDAAKQIATGYFQVKGQKQLIDLNVERAKRGLAPVDSASVAPTVKVQHGFTMPGGLNLGTIALIGGAGVLLLMMMRRK